jgi:SAM-dependent methyltransferase
VAGFDLPYFDQIIERLESEPGSVLGEAFRRHVHWGCYEDPTRADDSLVGYAAAAENLTRKICKAAGMNERLDVLDAGCGFGGTLAFLDEQWTGCRLVGLNIDGRQLDRARSRACTREGTFLAFLEADACKLPIAPGVFDVVLAVECIFHFPSRKQFFREAARVLRPGGTLALTDFVLAPGAAEPYSRWAGSSDVAESGFYGANRMPASAESYGRIAVRSGLRIVVDDDITANTLPTYPAMRRVYEEAALPDGVLATDYLEALASKGWVQYHLMSFERAAG